jgi:cation diffusion facilitator family transporter
VGIAATAIPRLLTPKPLQDIGVGLAISVLASLLNLGTALLLLRQGRRHNSITLEANAHHLLADVWTSVGVLAGVGLVALTSWQWLDPLVALIVATNILWTGIRIMQRSVGGLMDASLDPKDMLAVREVLQTYEQTGIQFHALRSRQSGVRKFISVHVLVPGDWTVQHGHELLDKIEADIRSILPDSSVFTHLESLNDPASWEDQSFESGKDG